MSRIRVDVDVAEGAEWPFSEKRPYSFDLKPSEVQVMLMTKRVRIDYDLCRIVDSESEITVYPSWDDRFTTVDCVKLIVEPVAR
jgi:hypothetical protein